MPSPPAPAHHSATPYRITSIIIGDSYRYAVVSGRRVQVGSRLGSGRVVAITPAKVTIKIEDRLVELPFIDLRVKTITKAKPE